MISDIYKHRRGRTAIHEAGHVVVALEEGRPFEDVVLARVADTNGAMHSMRYRPGDDEVARVLLGGIVAVRLCRRGWYPRLFDSAFDDIGLVAAFFRESGDAEWGVAWNVRATVKLIEDRWASVEAVALELLTHRRLSHASALAILAVKRPRRQTPFKLDDGAWARLVDYVHWRIKYPRGMEDALVALEALAAGKTGLTPPGFNGRGGAPLA